MPGDHAGRPGLVTVIINCFNGERWLRAAIESVYAQTYASWEIVFWDNKSTDASAAIAQSYGTRVRYFQSEQTTTLGAARRLALAVAEGQYVSFLDCDDVWLPDKLERQVAAMESGPYAICHGAITEIDATGRQIRTVAVRSGRGNMFDSLLRQFDIYLCAAMIRRSALFESGLTFDPAVSASEEYCLFMQLAARFPVIALRDTLALYRVHEGALTNASISRWAEEREYTLGLIERDFPALRVVHRAAFREAYARARYYRARLYAAKGAARRARLELASVATVHPRYAILWLLLFLPLSAWHRVHEWSSGRSSFRTT